MNGQTANTVRIPLPGGGTGELLGATGGATHILHVDDEQLVRIANVPKREFMRRGFNQHTLEKICKKEPVRVIKMAKCLKVLEGYESLQVTRLLAQDDPNG